MNIDYDTDIDVEYLKDRNAVVTQDDFTSFKEKWRELFPEITTSETKLELFLLLRDNSTEQNKYLFSEYQVYFDLLAPRGLLRLVFIAQQYGVTTGLAWIQQTR